MRTYAPAMRKPMSLILALSLAACGGLPFGKRDEPPPPLTASEPTIRPQGRPVAMGVVGGARTPEALDASTEAERAEALAAAAAGGRSLGQVTVALGSPAEQGFWLRGAVVPAQGKGRVVLSGGASVAVELIPGEGPALLSLAAYRALGLPLTELPLVTVYAE